MKCSIRRAALVGTVVSQFTAYQFEISCDTRYWPNLRIASVQCTSSRRLFVPDNCLVQLISKRVLGTVSVNKMLTKSASLYSEMDEYKMEEADAYKRTAVLSVVVCVFTLG